MQFQTISEQKLQIPFHKFYIRNLFLINKFYLYVNTSNKTKNNYVYKRVIKKNLGWGSKFFFVQNNFFRRGPTNKKIVGVGGWREDH